MDNLSTHSAGVLCDAFPAPEARRVLKRLQFHHTPKYASWLNLVEIEIGVLRCNEKHYVSEGHDRVDAVRAVGCMRSRLPL
jgi:hypothetical protein